MAEFQEVMRDWSRMCKANSIEDDGCKDCPVNNFRDNGCVAIYEIEDGIDWEEYANAITAWAAEHPEPVYPTWFEWLDEIGVLQNCITDREVAKALLDKRIPADIAQKLGVKPKEG